MTRAAWLRAMHRKYGEENAVLIAASHAPAGRRLSRAKIEAAAEWLNRATSEPPYPPIRDLLTSAVTIKLGDDMCSHRFRFAP